jgi:hypothetical protein
MIPFTSWSLSSSAQVEYSTASYTIDFTNPQLPTPYVVKAYDNNKSAQGTTVPSILNLVKNVGSPTNLIKATNGAYVELQLNNVYDVILLDTISVT